MNDEQFEGIEYNALVMDLYLRYKNTSRFLSTMVDYLESKGEMNDFIQQYRDTVIGEKKSMLTALNEQLGEMERLKSPEAVIDKKREEIIYLKSGA